MTDNRDDGAPDPWAKALRDANFVDPRNGEPSSTALATHTGISVTTITKMRNGTTVPKSSTIQKVADALRVDVREVSKWLGQARAELGPYVPPEDAHLLSAREREAVDEIIQLLALPKKKHPEFDTAVLHVVSQLKEGQDNAAERFKNSPRRELAARKGETREQKRRRTEIAPEDISQDPES